MAKQTLTEEQKTDITEYLKAHHWYGAAVAIARKHGLQPQVVWKFSRDLRKPQRSEPQPKAKAPRKEKEPKPVRQPSISRMVARAKKQHRLSTLQACACACVAANLKTISGLAVLNIYEDARNDVINNGLAPHHPQPSTLHGQTPEQQETLLATGA